ncbi:MAG TPA: helix-turn-helix domain-containing protein [Chryseosolibacter sp.]|nr:helix-turn-helix domain-containing protein [Chryseosolibacter sp.]
MDKITYSNVTNCPVTATMSVIGGKWKLLILFLISNGINRFGKMGMVLKDVSKQMLTTQLRELENDGIIERRIYPEIPPRVEYSLTLKGKDLMPIIESMKTWGAKYLLPVIEQEVLK